MTNDMDTRDYLNVAIIDKVINTKGSSPIKVLCDDYEIYIIKTAICNKEKTYFELINEVLCASLLNIWSIRSPSYKFAKIEKSIWGNFIGSEKIPKLYESENLSTTYFASKQIQNFTEFQFYFDQNFKKNQIGLFEKPIDLIKIGLFDLWVCNKDRTPSNPNLLIQETKKGLLNFIPIDHTAAFAYSSDYRNLTEYTLFLEDSFSILSSDFCKLLLSQLNKDELKKSLEEEFNRCIYLSLCQLRDILDLIPKEWGLTKNAKNNIFNILSNKERNAKISSRILQIL
jgi:hypothetical protein